VKLKMPHVRPHLHVASTVKTKASTLVETASLRAKSMVEKASLAKDVGLMFKKPSHTLQSGEPE
jgi:hypothetical protein